MLATGEVVFLRVSITGVALLACLIGVSVASAQTPTPDPAPAPAPAPAPVPAQPAPAPVAEPTPTPTSSSAPAPEPEPEAQPEPRVKPKVERKPFATHPSFAEKMSNYSGRAGRAGGVRASAPVADVRAAAAVAIAPDPHGSPIVLVLVFLLGSGSLVFVALRDVRVETFYAVHAAISDHRGEVAYVSLALILGLGIGLLATFGLA
jgi:outer membrane biosynthesis protein TonB